MLRTYALQHVANPGKQDKIRKTIMAYRTTAESIAGQQWRLFFQEAQGFNKNLDIKHLSSSLSERYKQTCQYQVVGVLDSFISNRQREFVMTVMRSNLKEHDKKKLLYINRHKLWYSRGAFSVWKSQLTIDVDTLKLSRKIFNHILGRHKKPSFRGINMALDSKVALITSKQPDKAISFDYWIRLSTTDKGKPVYMPLKTNGYFDGIAGKRKDFCHINLAGNNEITVSLIKDVPKPTYLPETPSIALDLGLATLFATNRGDLMGRNFYNVLQKYDALISRLAMGRQRQGLPVRSKRYDKLVSNLRMFMKNEINRVINRLVDLYKPAEIVVERLCFQNSNLSKRMNRLLSWFGKSYVSAKLYSIGEAFGIVITETNPAYSSQECSACGYVDKANRMSQAVFKCKCCDTGMHADVNAGRNHLKRSSFGVIDVYRSKPAVLRILTEGFLSNVERIPRLYSKAKGLLPENPYFRELLAQSKGFL